MKVSPKYKRFKHSQLMGDTFTPPDVRSSIIRTMQGCNQQQNTTNLWKLKKQTQNREIWIQNTDRILTVSDRAIRSNLHLNCEMIKHFLLFYSYEHKYHNKTLMNSFSYLCSYVYINVEMWLLMKRYIQRWIHIDTQEMEAWRGLPSWAFSWVFGEFLKFKSSSASLEKQSDFLRVKHTN